VLGLLGPNGAGKSTLVRALMGRVRPDRGRILLFGVPADTPGARDVLGYVPQEIALYPMLTAAENLVAFGRYLGLAGRRLDAAVDDGLAFSNLADRAGDPVEEFSGGMKRRLNLAVGILDAPRVVLLDEPTVGVDPQSRERIYAMIGELAGRGTAILYTTHYMEEAERLCDRIGILDEGEMKAEGTARELTRVIDERDSLHVVATGPLDRAAEVIGAIEGVDTVSVVDDGIHLVTADAAAVTARVIDAVTDAGATISSVEIIEPDLEAVFLHLTGKALRD
jgi:ABC-2 type transport system ATP-binding protein